MSTAVLDFFTWNFVFDKKWKIYSKPVMSLEAIQIKVRWSRAEHQSYKAPGGKLQLFKSGLRCRGIIIIIIIIFIRA